MAKTENRMMGVGCFAGQPTLSRVLARVMEAYSLGDWKHVAVANATASREHLLLQELLSGTSGMNDAYTAGKTEEKIAGFFIAFENQGPRLSVFTRRQGRQNGKYTTSLDELSRLRRSRLH